MLIYSIFQLPSWFFFGGGLECKRFGSLKRAGGGTTFQSARLHPRSVASRVRSPRGGFFRRFGWAVAGQRRAFFRFGVSDRAAGCFFLFWTNSPGVSVLFVGWIFLQAFPVDVVRSFSWKFVLGRKEVVGPKFVCCLRSTFWMWWWMSSFYLE